MNPPPIEKNVRCSTIAPAASKPARRSPLGCCSLRARGKHDVAVKQQVARFVEREWSACRPDSIRRASRIPFDRWINRRGIDRCRLVAGQSQQHCPVGARGPDRSAPAIRKDPPARAQHDRADRRPRARAQTGTPPASAPSYANSMGQPQSCRDRRDSWSRIRFYRY